MHRKWAIFHSRWRHSTSNTNFLKCAFNRRRLWNLYGKVIFYYRNMYLCGFILCIEYKILFDMLILPQHNFQSQWHQNVSLFVIKISPQAPRMLWYKILYWKTWIYKRNCDSRPWVSLNFSSSTINGWFMSLINTKK